MLNDELMSCYQFTVYQVEQFYHSPLIILFQFDNVFTHKQGEGYKMSDQNGFNKAAVRSKSVVKNA